MGFSRRRRQENSSEHSSGGTDINGEVNEESKKASSVIVNIAEFINSVLVKTVKVASSIEAVLIALSNLANTFGASSMAAAL